MGVIWNDDLIVEEILAQVFYDGHIEMLGVPYGRSRLIKHVFLDDILLKLLLIKEML